ncbi:MAG: formylglycine-generating enzyme family protein [Desulfobacterium sp.]|nr:formylglycine-generating enzyme family protein [Desulfobacterium sp.]
MRNVLCLAVTLCLVSILYRPGSLGAEEVTASDSWVEPNTGMAFVSVPGGCFMMGNNSGESDERPSHEACVYDFWIGRYEVTQGQWKAIMGSNPSRFKKGDNYPVEMVSWDDVKVFLKRLNEISTETFRLPTEAEWEYAATCGGEGFTFAGGDDIDAVAWYDGNSNETTHGVGTKAPNNYALYDMSGNVWEWCEDVHAWNAYSNTGRTTPLFLGKGFRKVDRGGSWVNFKGDVRATRRDRYNPEDKSSNLGFRLIREP